jgi:hypothetical protein
LITDVSEGGVEYLSSRIQKGLVLARGSKDLFEEGIGFGAPIIKYGNDAFFPGNIRLTMRKRTILSF